MGDSLLGGDQVLKLKIVSIQHTLKSVTKQKRVLAVVKPEAHFVEAGLQRLCANTVPRSNDCLKN
jgi:hypothetical protein